jgi:hypothetical protein
LIDNLGLLGISSISNLLSAIKAAKFYEMNEDDVIFTCLTDSAGMYESRIQELQQQQGDYKKDRALADFERYLLGEDTQDMMELTYHDRKRLHNFKYYTWIEQQGKTVEEINELWDPEFWEDVFSDEIVKHWDEQIEEFNKRTGLLDEI